MASAAAHNSQLIKAFENSFENVLANSRAGLAWQLRDPLAGAETSEGTDGGLSPPGWLSGLVGTQDSDTQTKAASYHVFALGPRLRKESYTPLCRFPLWGVRCRILSRAVTLQRFALPLNLPWVFSCVINQAAEPSGHCWSTTFIIVPKGFLWLDSRSFGSWNRDIHAARKTQACSTLQATPGTFPVSLSQSPGFCESPWILKVPAASKLTLGSSSPGRRASNRALYGSFWGHSHMARI